MVGVEAGWEGAGVAGCRMAQRTLTGGEADGEVGLLLGEVGALPHPRAVGAGVLLERDAGEDREVGADLHRLLPPHQAAHLSRLLVLEELEIARTPLLPHLDLLLPRVRLPSKQLRTHLEDRFLVLLTVRGLHLLKLHERLELHLRLLLSRERIVIAVTITTGLG